MRVVVTVSNSKQSAQTNGTDGRTINVELDLGQTACEVTRSRIESYDDREVSITLTEEGFEEYIRELRLQEHDDAAKQWLEE